MDKKRYLFDRLALYWRTWRRKGVATMDHRLWSFWVVTGRYPRTNPAARQPKP